MRLSFLALLSASTLLVPNVALSAPPTKHDCISANEDGQDLRRVGRMRAAIERFEVCAANACPGPLREDCTRRLTEARRALPTIVFAAKDTARNPVADVRVTMDGAPIAEKLDGAPINVEPGEHTFEFTAVGFAAASKRLVVQEGAKGRTELVLLAPASSVGAADGNVSMHGAEMSTQRTAAYAVGTAGIVGAVVGGVLIGLAIAADSRATEECGGTKTSCPPEKKVDVTQLEGKRDDYRTAAIVSGAAGAALLGVGLALYMTAPSGERKKLAFTGTGLWGQW